MPCREPRPARDFARSLRRRSTDAERALWWRLRDRQLAGFKVRRQHPVGPYFLDFYVPDAGLAVEIDGGQHAEQRARSDERRTRYLENEGIRVIRFWNNDVLAHPDAVLETILHALLRTTGDRGPDGD